MSRHYISLCFWNAGGSSETTSILSEIAVERSVDVVVVAESPVTSGKLALELSKNTGKHFSPDVVSVNGRLTWAFSSSVKVSPVFDGDKVSIRQIQPPLGPSVLICALHASSRLNRDVAELNVLIPRIAKAVEAAELKNSHDRTIVCGDFNLSPFDHGIVSSESFHAVMSRKVAQKSSRLVYDERRKFFYNPMWKLIAEEDEQFGTFYLRTNSPLEYFWHCVDQMLFRPSLLGNLPSDGVSIIRKTANHSLIGVNGRPKTSDHLPLVSMLKI